MCGRFGQGWTLTTVNGITLVDVELQTSGATNILGQSINKIITGPIFITFVFFL